jgi:hypothetical protein
VPRFCPRCHSKVIRRSKRRGLFELSLLSVIPVRPFRCDDCDCRFYALASAADQIQSTPVAARSQEGAS